MGNARCNQEQILSAIIWKNTVVHYYFTYAPTPKYQGLDIHRVIDREYSRKLEMYSMKDTVKKIIADEAL